MPSPRAEGSGSLFSETREKSGHLGFMWMLELRAMALELSATLSQHHAHLTKWRKNSEIPLFSHPQRWAGTVLRKTTVNLAIAPPHGFII